MQYNYPTPALILKLSMLQSRHLRTESNCGKNGDIQTATAERTQCLDDLELIDGPHRTLCSMKSSGRRIL